MTILSSFYKTNDWREKPPEIYFGTFRDMPGIILNIKDDSFSYQSFYFSKEEAEEMIKELQLALTKGGNNVQVE